MSLVFLPISTNKNDGLLIQDYEGNSGNAENEIKALNILSCS